MMKSRLSSAKTALVIFALACGGDDEPAASSPPTGGVQSGGGAVPASGGAGGGGATTTGTGGVGGANAPPSGTGATPASGGVAGGDGGAVASGGGSTGTGGDGAPQVMACTAPTQNPSSGNPCHDEPPAPLQFTEVASGLAQPLYVTHAPGDASRLFVVERRGTIRLIKDGTLVQAPFLDISSKVNPGIQFGGGASERGLLGLAFEPDYASSGRFWVNYTALGQTAPTTIESYQVNADGDTADPNSGQVLLQIDQPAPNHNGGMVAFGPDNCLYIGMGDGGGMNDTYNNGQDDTSPLGGILRVDVDNYDPDTPTPGNVLRHPHLWSYGLRNPWRFSFDRETGDMYMGDVGQGEWEEVNVEPRGVAGLNYGWPEMEGPECRPGVNCDPSGFVLPMDAQPNQDTQNQSVIGGYVYRGQAIPSLVGRYIYADYNSRRIWSFTWQGGNDTCDAYELTEQLATGDLIASFGEDANGELYVLAYNDGGGRVLRIDPQ